MKIIFLIVICVMILVNVTCGEPAKEAPTSIPKGWRLWTTHYDNGNKKLECYIDRNSRYQGKLTKWYESGEKKIECYYKDDKKHGKCVSWYKNGQKLSEVEYNLDKKIGKWTTWSPCREKSTSVIMGEGHKGKLIYWYENGKKKEEIEYEDGVENGIYRYYGSIGVKYVDGIFTKNIPSGKWTFYNKSESKIIEIDYDLKNLTGKWRSWYDNGNKHAQGEFAYNDKCASFNPSHFGQSYIKDFYDGFRKKGIWTFWHDNGKKSHEGFYRIGKSRWMRNGIWKYWNTKEKLIKKEFYHHLGYLEKTYMTDNYSEIPFTILYIWGDHSPKKPEVLLVNDAEDHLTLTSPGIDLETNQVVAFFWGRKSSTGYSLSVTSVKGNKKELEITFKTKRPNGLTSPAITYPSIVIAVPKSDKVKVIITGDRMPIKYSSKDFSNLKTANLEILIKE